MSVRPEAGDGEPRHRGDAETRGEAPGARCPVPGEEVLGARCSVLGPDGPVEPSTEHRAPGTPVATARPPFAHPIEAEFARLLDFYRVRWEYEPKSFPLEWGADGLVKLSFTPDFYLPDQDLFVELTTLSPRLMHRKNRKLRKLRERYPDVRIKLFSLRDVRALLLKYGSPVGKGE